MLLFLGNPIIFIVITNSTGLFVGTGSRTLRIRLRWRRRSRSSRGQRRTTGWDSAKVRLRSGERVARCSSTFLFLFFNGWSRRSTIRSIARWIHLAIRWLMMMLLLMLMMMMMVIVFIKWVYVWMHSTMIMVLLLLRWNRVIRCVCRWSVVVCVHVISHIATATWKLCTVSVAQAVMSAVGIAATIPTTTAVVTTGAVIHIVGCSGSGSSGSGSAVGRGSAEGFVVHVGVQGHAAWVTAESLAGKRCVVVVWERGPWWVWTIGITYWVTAWPIGTTTHCHRRFRSQLSLSGTVIDLPIRSFAWFIDRTRYANKAFVEGKIMTNRVLKKMDIYDKQKNKIFMYTYKQNIPSSRFRRNHSTGNGQSPIDRSH